MTQGSSRVAKGVTPRFPRGCDWGPAEQDAHKYGYSAFPLLEHQTPHTLGRRGGASRSLTLLAVSQLYMCLYVSQSNKQITRAPSGD